MSSSSNPAGDAARESTLAAHQSELLALFRRDEEKLQQFLDDIAHLCDRGHYQPAARVFGEFRPLLEQRLGAEERTLNALETRGRCPLELSARVLAAHRRLRELTEASWRGITHHDAVSCRTVLHALVEAVEEHERGVREQLFPLLCSCYTEPWQLHRAVQALVDR